MASTLLDRARSAEGKKMIRYTLTSVISVAVSQVILIALHLIGWSAKSANITAVCVSAVPSYVLNRTWAWGKRGKSHLWKEVVPFWVLALIGLAFSTWAADWAESQFHDSTVAVALASLGAFGILWIAKFIIFNKILFVHHEEDLPPALDGRTGLPT